MDYNKVGKFITVERKAKNLTQAKLAEKLFVSEKTVSKWENGKGLPDTNSLPKLCEIFGVSINELLNGERIVSENYVNKAEQKLLELQNAKVQADKHLLTMEIVLGVFSVLFLLAMCIVASVITMQEWVRIVLIVVGVIMCLFGSMFALKIEQVAGYYKCPKCNHKYVPTFKQMSLSMHMGRTRSIKCPHCNKKSWHKKVVK